MTHGDYTKAWRHYWEADASYPGNWHTDEYFAELLAAEGWFDEAIAPFRKLIELTLKPELQQTLGGTLLA